MTESVLIKLTPYVHHSVAMVTHLKLNCQRPISHNILRRDVIFAIVAHVSAVLRTPTASIASTYPAPCPWRGCVVVALSPGTRRSAGTRQCT